MRDVLQLSEAKAILYRVIIFAAAATPKFNGNKG